MLPELMYDEKACVGCSGCVDRCPSKCHHMEEERHLLERSRCTVCGGCAEQCLFGASELKGTWMDSHGVMSEVARDVAYYRETGGGVTLSGGEPMSQVSFTLVLLKAAKELGIHTCIETCGFAPWSGLSPSIPHTDLFLFDYKATDPVLHRNLTGVDNTLIVSNLLNLLALGASVVLRCPLVAGLNDDDDHLLAISRLSSEFPSMGVEIMAYHNLGVVKEFRLGKVPALDGVDNTSEDIKVEWLERLSGMGCSIAKIG